MRTDTMRLLEDGRIEELVALLDGAGDNEQAVNLLKQLAAQHNQQRNVQSITDSRYEIRWEKSASAAPASGAQAGEGSTWLLIGDDAEALPPLVDVLTARGHRHQHLGLPMIRRGRRTARSALRAAVADEPALRILHLAALDPDGAASTQSLERMQHPVLSGTRRLFRAAPPLNSAPHLAGNPRRTTCHRRRHRVTDQSCLWGFGRAAALEHPRLWGGLADLPEGGADDWSRLIDQLMAPPRAKTISRCGIKRSMSPADPTRRATDRDTAGITL